MDTPKYEYEALASDFHPSDPSETLFYVLADNIADAAVMAEEQASEHGESVWAITQCSHNRRAK